MDSRDRQPPRVLHVGIESDAITVEFKGGSLYRYTYASAGKDAIEAMKVLARSGDGLNSYIRRNVYRDYAAKLR